MLIEMAVGDAYGAGFEYVAPDRVRTYNDLSRYIQHQKHLNLKPGKYTDDTQMSIAVAEAMVDLLTERIPNWTPEYLAGKFVDCFKRDVRPGYASGFYKFLCEVGSGEEFIDKIRPHSNKSGGAMRACPIGFAKHVVDVVFLATVQCRITHDHEDAITAAQAAALTAHYCIYNKGDKEDVFEFLDKYITPGKIVYWEREVGSPGLESASAAITAFSRNDKLSGLLKDCIAFTGDVDTVATIALACASESKQYKKDLPDHLLKGLEPDGKYGQNYLGRLDGMLREAAQEGDE